MSLLLNRDESISLSVLMSVYNGADHVAAAIESILAQTFQDFEFIIINDGSTDKTAEILDRYAAQDARIRVVHQSNTGLTRALNFGLGLARGTYIARQDADDVSYPERFARQFALFRANPALVLVGGVSDDVHESGARDRWPYHDAQAIRRIAFEKTPFPHSTAMFCAQTAQQLGGYDIRYKTAQDFEFWMRFAKVGDLMMVEQPILKRFIHVGAISSRRRYRQFFDALRARLQHHSNPVAGLFYALKGLLAGYLPLQTVRWLKGRSQA